MRFIYLTIPTILGMKHSDQTLLYTFLGTRLSPSSPFIAEMLSIIFPIRYFVLVMLLWSGKNQVEIWRRRRRRI